MQPSGKRHIQLSWQWEHLIGWGVTIALCSVPIVLWYQLHSPETITTFGAWLLNFGRITGLVGTVMYALNLVFATRLKFLEFWFGGLNRVYIAHHVLGGLALVMLSLHPLLLAMRYVVPNSLGQMHLKEAALVLLPNGIFPIEALFNTSHDFHQSVLQQWAIFFGIIAFWGMVGLLLVTFFIIIPYRLWLISHKFLGVAFVISALHIIFINSDTSASGAMKTYMLVMIGIGVAAFIYRTLAGNILIKHFTYQVREVNIPAQNVVQITLDALGKGMPYKPGQFVFIRFRHAGGDISREWHPFSISSSPRESGLQLSIKALGDYTSRLSAIQVGTIADIEGAYGRFSYVNHRNRNQIWIAGGIGISPFLSMVKDMPESGMHVDLYYSVRNESELIDWSLLYNSAMRMPDALRVIPFISERETGFLDVPYIIEKSGDIVGKDFYICGPPAMMASIKKQLRAQGVPGASIHSEEFAMS